MSLIPSTSLLFLDLIDKEDYVTLKDNSDKFKLMDDG